MMGMQKAIIVSKKWKDIKTLLYTGATILIPAGFGLVSSSSDTLGRLEGLFTIMVGAVCFWIAQHTNGNGDNPNNPLGTSAGKP